MINQDQQQDIIDNLKNIRNNPLQLYITSKENFVNLSGFILNFCTRVLHMSGIYSSANPTSAKLDEIIKIFDIKEDHLTLVGPSFLSNIKKEIVVITKPNSLFEFSLILSDLLIKNKYDFLYLDQIEKFLGVNESSDITGFLQYLAIKLNSKYMGMIAILIHSESSSDWVSKIRNRFNRVSTFID